MKTNIKVRSYVRNRPVQTEQQGHADIGVAMIGAMTIIMLINYASLAIK